MLRTLSLLTQAVKVRGRKKLEDRLRALLASDVQPVGPFYTNSIGVTFTLVWPGTFMMGSPNSEEGRNDDEKQHAVTLTKGYWLAAQPITRLAWKRVMGSTPNNCKADDRPVERVSWDDCQLFLKRMSKKDGRSYRLPTEAEWEYACRSGTTTPFFFGNEITRDQANFADGTAKSRRQLKTVPVGTFPHNAWGLFDMHGNVWEWCADFYGSYPRGHVVDPEGPGSGDGRILRGGAFVNREWVVRSARRIAADPSDRDNGIGFRPAVTVV